MFPTLKHTIIALSLLDLIIIDLADTSKMERIILTKFKITFFLYFCLFLLNLSFGMSFELLEIFLTKILNSLFYRLSIRIYSFSYFVYQLVNRFISNKHSVFTIIKHQEKFWSLLVVLSYFKIFK